MATISELMPKIKPWDRGLTIAKTLEGIRIGHCDTDKAIFAIKMLRLEMSQEERKRWLERCKELAHEYFVKVFEVEKREIWWRSDLYDCNVCFGASEYDGLSSDEAIVYRVMCPIIGSAEWLTMAENSLKRAFPFGYECFKLLVQYDVNAIYKLRKYTKKVLRRTFGVEYRDFDIKKGLFSSELGDLPEDYFMSRLTEILSWFWEGNRHEFVRYEIMEDLQKLPNRVKEDLRYWREKYIKEDSIEQSNWDLRSLDKLERDTLVIANLEEARHLLTPKENEVLEYRYLNDNQLTLKETGEALGGITPPKV